MDLATSSQRSAGRGKLRLMPLVAATYFMVSGGPYGMEEILGGAGFARAIGILLLLPLLWSLPTALMIGELASAMPEEGGFYVWVRRALGPFWGFQESWLSLAASVFDMAIYPAIFVLYLGKLSPALTAGGRGYLWSLAVVALCCLWNLRGAPAVGQGSLWFFALLLAPFAVLFVLCCWRGWTQSPVIQWMQTGSGGGSVGLSTAILVAMWNYMGWDNASTVAREVDDPQRNYPRAMLAATLLVALSYVLPVVGLAVSGLPVDSFLTGDWTTAARSLGGPLLGLAVAAGGAMTGVGMFNALVMSYSRLPMAMAEDGFLPRALARRNRHDTPWLSVLLCGLAWALALKLPFERLISIDLMLYGVALLLEFVALVVLRVREPEMPRPFRAGNLACAVALGLGPLALILYALWASRGETVGVLGETPALLLALAVGLLGPLFYGMTALRRQRPAEEAAD